MLTDKVTEYIAAQELDHENLSDYDKLKIVFKRGILKPMDAKTQIFLEGEEAEYIYFVKEGLIRLYMMSENGREKDLLWLQPGNMFGEEALLDNACYTYNAESIRSAKVVAMHRDVINDIREKRKTLNDMLIRHIIKIKQQIQRENVSLIFGTSQKNRLRNRLMLLATEIPDLIQDIDDSWIQLRITHKELGDMIGAARERVTVMLQELELDSYVQRGTKNKDVRINLKGLQEKGAID